MTIDTGSDKPLFTTVPPLPEEDSGYEFNEAGTAICLGEQFRLLAVKVQEWGDRYFEGKFGGYVDCSEHIESRSPITDPDEVFARLSLVVQKAGWHIALFDSVRELRQRYPFVPEDLPTDIWGDTLLRSGIRTIFLRNDEPSELFHILLHEDDHRRLFDEGVMDDGAEGVIDMIVASEKIDIPAECIAYLVNRYFGIESDHHFLSSIYIAKLCWNFQVNPWKFGDFLLSQQDDIIKRALRVIREIEEVMEI